jgi:hypothetical protein
LLSPGINGVGEDLIELDIVFYQGLNFNEFALLVGNRLLAWCPIDTVGSTDFIGYTLFSTKNCYQGTMQFVRLEDEKGRRKK